MKEVHRNTNWADLNRSPRTVADAHHETDVVLRFFAGYIIRTLHLSGTKEDILWASCDQHCRDTFVRCLQKFPSDWIRSFQLFVSEERHLQPRNTRANSRKSGRFGSTNLHSCHLARSITIGAQSFVRHAILASITARSLIFILPAREADGGHFHYIEIPGKCISQCTQCTTKDLGEQKYALCLILDMAGSLMTNGEEKPCNGSTVYITSDNDLRELYNALKESENKPQKGRVIRRISSTVVALDNGEEVARKSTQYCESSSEQQACLSVNTGDAIDYYQESGIPTQPASEENTQSELARAAPAIDESQPRASQEMYKSGAALRETCLPVSPGKKAISEPRDGDAQPPEKVHPIDADTSLAETCFEKSDIPVSKDLTSNAESQANADNSTRPQTSNVASITLQPRRFSRSSTCEHETQNKSPVSRNKRGRASSNRKNRSKLPDTQESLLFCLRRSTRKVYASNSKAAVDWEEDLRPTEEDETEREVPKDLDVTSISSPSPGGKSIFNRKPNTTQNKRKARATPSSIKNKKQTKRNRTSGNRVNKRATKLPLQPKESYENNDKLKGIDNPRTNDATENINGGIESDSRAKSRPDILSGKESSPELAPRSTKANNNTFSVGGQDLSSDKENLDPSAKSQHKQGEPGNVVIGGIDSEMKTALNLQERDLGKDRYSLSQNNDTLSFCDDAEQTSLTGCMGSLVADKRPAHQMTLDQREDSSNSKAVSKTDEELRLLPASAEKYPKIDTPTQTAANEENKNDSQRYASEQYHPASDNKKRCALHDPGESQRKKLRMNVSPDPEQAALHQAGHSTAKNSEYIEARNCGNDGASTERPTAVKRRTIPSAGEECFTVSLTTPPPKACDFGVESILSPFNVSSQAKLSLLSTSSPRKSIVDENGSPRLLSRHHDTVDPTRGLQFSRFEYVNEDTNSQSEYYGDHDDADFTDYSMSNNSSISTLRGPHTIASTTKESKAHSFSALPSDTDEVEEAGHFNMGSRIPVTEKLRRCAKEPNQPVDTMITPYSILGSPRKEASPEVQDPVSQGSLSNDFSQPQPEVTEPSKSVEKGHSQPDWQGSLETMQKATQDMLLSTNQVSPTVCVKMLLKPTS